MTLDEVGGKPAANTLTLIPGLGEGLRAWFTKLDADQSRTITRDELDNPREIRGADRNADGEVSYREANRFFEDMQATLAARANPDIYFPWKKTEGQKPLRTAESGDPLLELSFTPLAAQRRNRCQRPSPHRHRGDAPGDTRRDALCHFVRLEPRQETPPVAGRVDRGEESR